MNRVRDFFPLGIASGSAFCNRKEEIKLLLNNVKNGKHSLLMAPRRYGKSSLAEHVVALSKLPSVEVDFYMARSEKVVEAYILGGVSELVAKALGPVDRLLVSIKRYVKKLKPKINIETRHISLELSTEEESDPASNVKEALLLLEQLLAEKEQQAVMLLDEFQTVGVIAKGLGIEGAIRHIAQKTKYLSIVFSGSNRKLLATMFEDDTRPLYKLCWKLTIDRIAYEHYEKHLNKAAKAAWNEPIPEKVVQTITALTERHPYYMNKFCDRLWTYFDSPPTVQQTKKTWQEVIKEEKNDAVKEISALSNTQKTALLLIAQSESQKMTSKAVLFKAEMSSSTMITALDYLQGKDIIEQIPSGYRIVNPIIKFYAQIAEKG